MPNLILYLHKGKGEEKNQTIYLRKKKNRRENQNKINVPTNIKMSVSIMSISSWTYIIIMSRW